jgi:hypothetical protein
MLTIYLILIFLVILTNKLASIYAEHRASGGKLLNPYQPLPDIIQEILPKINTHIPDYLLCTLLLFCVIFKNINYRELNALVFSLLTRPLFIIVTTLPACMPTKKGPVSIYSSLFLSSFDLMFSGHTCVFMFIGKILENNFGIFVQLILPITLIMARQHYTIDVLCAMFVYNYFYILNFSSPIF